MDDELVLKELTSRLLLILEELGCVIDQDDKGEFLLIDYLADSMTFMLFMVSVERELSVSIPEDVIALAINSPFNRFVKAISELV